MLRYHALIHTQYLLVDTFSVGLLFSWNLLTIRQIYNISSPILNGYTHTPPSDQEDEVEDVINKLLQLHSWKCMCVHIYVCMYIIAK